MRTHGGTRIAAFLAGVTVVWSLAMFSWIIIQGIPDKLDKQLVTMIVQGVFGLVMLIAGYYWGSSEGSRLKDDTIAQSSPPGAEVCRYPHEHEGLKKVEIKDA